MKTETCKLYSRVSRIFLPNFSKKLILIIFSYTVSKLVHFLRHSVVLCLLCNTIDIIRRQYTFALPCFIYCIMSMCVCDMILLKYNTMHAFVSIAYLSPGNIPHNATCGAGVFCLLLAVGKLVPLRRIFRFRPSLICNNTANACKSVQIGLLHTTHWQRSSVVFVTMSRLGLVQLGPRRSGLRQFRRSLSAEPKGSPTSGSLSQQLSKSSKFRISMMVARFSALRCTSVIENVGELTYLYDTVTTLSRVSSALASVTTESFVTVNFRAATHTGEIVGNKFPTQVTNPKKLRTSWKLVGN